MHINIREVATIIGPAKAPAGRGREAVEVRQPTPELPGVGLTPQACQTLREYRARLARAPVEHFLAFAVSRDGRLVGLTEFTGTADCCRVDVPLVLTEAQAFGAAAVYAMHCHPNGTMDESELDKRFTENFRQRLAGQQMLLLHHEIVPGKPPATGTGVNAPVYLVDARYQTREFGVNDAGEITTEEGVTLTAQELLAPLAEHWPVLDQNGAQWYVTVSTTGTVNCTSSTVNTRTIMSTAFRWAARRSPNNTLWHLRPSTGGVLQAVTTQPSTGPGITAWIQLNDANGLPWVLEVSNAGAISATRVL